MPKRLKPKGEVDNLSWFTTPISGAPCVLSQAFAQRVFYEIVEQMTADGTLGEWVVGGQTIQAAPETKMDFKHGSAKKGSYIKVESKISESGEYCY